MKTLQLAENSLKIAKNLMDLNQETFVRDENLRPVSVNWTIENHAYVFQNLYSLINDLELTVENLKKL